MDTTQLLASATSRIKRVGNATFRSELIMALELLFSQERIIALFEGHQSSVVCAEDFTHLWFSHYHADSDWFWESFSPSERAVLTRFQHFCEQRRDRLRECRGTIYTCLANPVWQQIRREARTTLEQIVTALPGVGYGEMDNKRRVGRAGTTKCC